MISFTVAMTAALVLSSAAAYALPISLTAVDGNLYVQTSQSPCVFSIPNCHQPGGFASTPVPNGGSEASYNLLSPVYSGATISGVIGAGNPIVIGLDINQASGQPPQTLSAFEMLKNGIVVDTFSFAGVGNVPATNNGQGYADYLLAGFSSFLATDTIQFHFVFNNANDGPENLFLTGAPGTPTNPLPEPASLVLLGSGLLVAARQLRKNTKI